MKIILSCNGIITFFITIYCAALLCSFVYNLGYRLHYCSNTQWRIMLSNFAYEVHNALTLHKLNVSISLQYLSVCPSPLSH